MMEPIILASQSRGRRELLENVGLPIIPLPADIDETIPWEDPAEEITGLAVRKAWECHRCHPERTENWIIAADTLVVFQGKPIGKPRDRNEARAFLKALSGREHQVISGVAFLDRRNEKMHSSCDITKVQFARLSDQEIESYLDTGEWQGAAGAYRIQHKGAFLVEKIEGSFTGVIGLPLYQLYIIMKEAGYPAY